MWAARAQLQPRPACLPACLPGTAPAWDCPVGGSPHRWVLGSLWIPRSTPCLLALGEARKNIWSKMEITVEELMFLLCQDSHTPGWRHVFGFDGSACASALVCAGHSSG